jgi:outer membrane protein insertion porin family
MQKTGGDIRMSRAIPKLTYTRGRVSYKLENVKVRGVSDPTMSARIPEGLRSAIAFGIVRDSRDNYLNPTVGTRNNIDIECSGGILGGQLHYHRETFETSTYHKLYWKFVLGLRAKLGIINGYTSDSQVPLYERLVLGGIGAWGLRGYKDWTVGCEDNGTVVGGRFASLVTVETKIAFPNNIYPLLFFDAGNAWECLSNANLQDWKRAVGVGFRIEIPMMGLVGFDMGYRIDPTPRQPLRGWEFHLQMGRSF